MAEITLSGLYIVVAIVAGEEKNMLYGIFNAGMEPEATWEMHYSPENVLDEEYVLRVYDNGVNRGFSEVRILPLACLEKITDHQMRELRQSELIRDKGLTLEDLELLGVELPLDPM